ncbi:M57 family metalloprotease [Pedobacter nototheniae]|uniref:M57 family metalloprotease n=1 Tax=Pedobacter nototheniae TaxID=2488994 RepID=UPI0013F41ACD|nr:MULTISPECIES: M57 family metalloprotease [Pedobacter]
MKTNLLKSKLSYLLIFLAGTAVAISCKKNNNSNTLPEEETTELTKTELSAIAKAGFSPFNVIKKDGGYLVEGDIFLDAKNIANQQAIVSDLRNNKTSTEQYRTTNIVSVNTSRELKIKVDAGASQTVFSNATTEAIKRYNDLKLKLTFRLLGAASTETADIVINGADLGTASNGGTILGQSAGFPSGGNPASPIKLSNVVYNANYNNNNLLATVIAHEIGHAIGFRHTDYMNRAYSCGASFSAATVKQYKKLYPTRNLENEEDLSFIISDMNGTANDSPGAILIPGTPSNPDPKSWMLACSDGTNRPFTTYDLVAIKGLYPVK